MVSVLQCVFQHTCFKLSQTANYQKTKALILYMNKTKHRISAGELRTSRRKPNCADFSMLILEVTPDAYCIAFMRSFIIFSRAVSCEWCKLICDLPRPCVHSKIYSLVYFSDWINYAHLNLQHTWFKAANLHKLICGSDLATRSSFLLHTDFCLNIGKLGRKFLSLSLSNTETQTQM